MVNNVELPKWSNQCIHTFLYLHRKALESDYVSEHLNEWIDLIFGYKQRGEEAVKALNVFYYLTYQDKANLEKITDLKQQLSIRTQIQHYGQCPNQLFNKPHPKRFSNSSNLNLHSSNLNLHSSSQMLNINIDNANDEDEDENKDKEKEKDSSNSDGGGDDEKEGGDEKEEKEEKEEKDDDDDEDNDDDDDDYYDENTYGFGKKRIKFENLIKKIDEENKEFNRQLMANYEEEDGEKELMLNILNSTKPSNKNQENDHNNDNDNANDNKPDENQNIPKVQMKNLNWKPISQQKIQNTIWSKISMEKVELNTEKLEKYFNLSDTLNEILNNKKEIKVLSKERSIKYETVLNKINIPLGELKAGIMNFDEKAISVQQLKDLIDLSSTNSEFSKIAEYKEIKKNDNNFLNSNSINIGRGEEFLIEMSVIPNFLNKLNSWYCQRTFKDKIKKINTMNEDILLACNELRSSKSLKTILRVILAIGNYLNGGTFRGGAHGFKLSSLTKLYNVKGNNINSPNLLHYLGYFLKLKYPDAKQLLSQLPHLSAATRTKNSFIKKEFLKINFGLKAIQNELSHFEHHRNNDKNIINNNDNNQINLLFFKIMNPFLNDAISEFKKCVNSFSNCQKRFSETISYFGEDYKLKPSDFFAPIFDFCKKLDRILNESGLQRTTTTFPRAKQSGVGLLEGIFKTLRTKIDITMVNDEN
eukprot:Anaeramoba_flamelloidesa807776_78.p1 GENE.a807776_78~~a807776_78.p1  ORF type:complete len:701 (+),score=207.42 a807776_78:51-2153(+)